MEEEFCKMLKKTYVRKDPGYKFWEIGISQEMSILILQCFAIMVNNSLKLVGTRSEKLS